jgi:antitoxin CptB
MPHAADKDNLSIKKKRISFRCWHRGTREMDLLLGRFADAEVEKMSEKELDLFEDFLNNSDPDIYNWVSGQEPFPASEENELTKRLIIFYLK